MERRCKELEIKQEQERDNYSKLQVNKFIVWLRNRLISAGLEPFLSLNEKSYIVSYYTQFSTYIKMLNHNIKTRFVCWGLRHLIFI